MDNHSGDLALAQRAGVDILGWLEEKIPLKQTSGNSLSFDVSDGGDGNDSDTSRRCLFEEEQSNAGPELSNARCSIREGCGEFIIECITEFNANIQGKCDTARIKLPVIFVMARARCSGICN